MTPEVARHIAQDDIELLKRIHKALDRLPDLDLGVTETGEKIPLSCHILARAIAIVFDLEHRDGKFLKVFQHSWLVTRHENIIDAYPVGIIGGPLLVDGGASLLTDSLYQTVQEEILEKMYGQMFRSEWFARAVELTACALCSEIPAATE